MNTWNPADDLALPLNNPEPTDYDVVGLFDGTDAEIAARFAVMAACPRHRFRARIDDLARAGEWFAWWRSDAWPDACSPDSLNPWAGMRLGDGSEEGQQRAVDRLWNAQRNDWPSFQTLWQSGQALPNLMLGTTIRTQAEAAERLPLLDRLPARWRFVRVEPSEALDMRALCACGVCVSWELLDLVEVAGGVGPEQLRLVQDIGRQVLDAQGRYPDCHGRGWFVPSDDAIIAACGGCHDGGIGPALAIVAADVCPGCQGWPNVFNGRGCWTCTWGSRDTWGTNRGIIAENPKVWFAGHGVHQNQKPVGWRS